MKKSLVVLILILAVFLGFSQKSLPYKTPNKAILDLVNAPTFPDISVSPNGEFMLLLSAANFASIAELAKPVVRVAGLQINAATNSASKIKTYDTISLVNIDNGKEFSIVGLPTDLKAQHIQWSPSGAKVAFSNTVINGLELWVLDIEKLKAEKLTEPIINATVLSEPIQWADDGETLVFAAVVHDRGGVPHKELVPDGPFVLESRAKETAVAMHQNLLQNEHDVALFKYYTKSQLIKINLKKEQQIIGSASMFKAFSFSPNKAYILVKMMHEPFSYMVPYDQFPYKVEIWKNEGQLWRELFDVPLIENIPMGFDAVRKGPRNIQWRTDKPSSIYWVKAMDDGDPKQPAVIRDHLFLFEPPFDGKGEASIQFEYRFKSIAWGIDNFAIATEQSWNDRLEQVSSFNPSNLNEKKQVLYQYNVQDRYNHPGYFVTTSNAFGEPVLAFVEKESALLLKSEGATTAGNKPFIDQYDLKTKTTKRLWHCNNPYYEYPLQLLDAKKIMILSLRESKTDVPNYFARNIENGVVTQLTNFANPYPELLKVKQELVQYSNVDGLGLSAMLYLPPDFSVGDSLLPTLLWTNPIVYKNGFTAAQINVSPNKFITLRWDSPLFWVLRGYAVFDQVAMPLVIEEENKAADLFSEQMLANAKAAVLALDSMGIVDKSRMAIGGHGYGALVTANVLSHSTLFAAGIARSGTFNLVNVPFGCQLADQSFWEAKDIYEAISPFSFANKISAPLVLIHGSDDNEPVFSPMQSELYYTALKGNGAKTRLVMLPFEGHDYLAKESVYHMLWEMDRWLYLHVKNKKD